MNANHTFSYLISIHIYGLCFISWIMCTTGGLGRYIGRYVDRYIGRLSTDSRALVGRQSADSRPTVDRWSAD